MAFGKRKFRRRPRRMRRRRFRKNSYGYRRPRFFKGVTNTQQNRPLQQRARRITFRNKTNKRRSECIQPNTTFRMLPYYTRAVINLGVSAGPVFYQFRANSIYDPDLTGTGHQPRGRDQLDLLYRRYQVYAVQVTVDFYLPVNNDHTLRCFIAGKSPTDGSLWFTAEDIEEHTGGNLVLGTALPNVDRSVVTLKAFFRCADLLGVPAKHYNTDSEYYSADFNNNPAIVPVIDVGCYVPDGTIGFTAEAYCHLTYFTRCSEPKALSQS